MNHREAKPALPNVVLSTRGLMPRKWSYSNRGHASRTPPKFTPCRPHQSLHKFVSTALEPPPLTQILRVKSIIFSAYCSAVLIYTSQKISPPYGPLLPHKRYRVRSWETVFHLPRPIGSARQRRAVEVNRAAGAKDVIKLSMPCSPASTTFLSRYASKKGGAPYP